MVSEQSGIENIWEMLLSRELEWIRVAFETLDSQEKKAVRAHLHKMVEEPGWQPEQRISAQAALEALPEDAG